MTEQPPAGFRRHRFLEQSIDLPGCGHEAEPGEAMRPVEAWSEQSAQLFDCADVEACTARQKGAQ